MVYRGLTRSIPSAILEEGRGGKKQGNKAFKLNTHPCSSGIKLRQPINRARNNLFRACRDTDFPNASNCFLESKPIWWHVSPRLLTRFFSIFEIDFRKYNPLFESKIKINQGKEKSEDETDFRLEKNKLIRWKASKWFRLFPVPRLLPMRSQTGSSPPPRKMAIGSLL